MNVDEWRLMETPWGLIEMNNGDSTEVSGHVPLPLGSSSTSFMVRVSTVLLYTIHRFCFPLPPTKTVDESCL